MIILVSPLSRATGLVRLARLSALRQLSPLSRPNESLIALADAAMSRGGRMTAAIVETGRALPWPDVAEGRPFELPAVITPNKHAAAWR